MALGRPHRDRGPRLQVGLAGDRHHRRDRWAVQHRRGRCRAPDGAGRRGLPNLRDCAHASVHPRRYTPDGRAALVLSSTIRPTTDPTALPSYVARCLNDLGHPLNAAVDLSEPRARRHAQFPRPARRRRQPLRRDSGIHGGRRPHRLAQRRTPQLPSPRGRHGTLGPARRVATPPHSPSDGPGGPRPSRLTTPVAAAHRCPRRHLGLRCAH